MITIYHLGVSQSDRIVWLMEELELPYRLEWFDRRQDNMLAPPEYRALHPTAMAPTIRDGDIVLTESVAIIEYIIQRHADGRLSVPIEQSNYPDYLYWMSFSLSLMSSIMTLLACKKGGDQGRYREVFQERTERYLNFMNTRLGEVQYLAGPEFTAADIQNLFALTTMPRFGGPSVDNLHNIVDYLGRVTQRPAYLKAMTIAGPDATRPE